MQIKNKVRISALIKGNLDEMMNNYSKKENISKSHIVESALQNWFEKKLAEEADELAKMEFEDLPSEDEWCAIQSKIQ